MAPLDVVVIGAGAAGLAAASTLREVGCHIVVIEARERLGGRIWTERVPWVSAPIELGAEWVHGLAPQTRALARKARARVVELRGSPLRAAGGVLSSGDSFWQNVRALVSRLDPDRSPDRTIGEAISDAEVDEDIRSEARRYIEGFHAADLSLASESAIARAEKSESGSDAQARLEGGYHSIVDALARGLGEDELRLGTVARCVSWSEGRVRVECEGAADGLPRAPALANAVVIAVPLGVLREGSIAISPEPGYLRRALAALEPGHAARITLALRRPLGEVIGRPDTTFLMTGDEELPVWWTAHPLHAPLLVGWRGGPGAASLLRAGDEALAARAKQALAGALGMSAHDVEELVVHAWSLDWSSDPFSRGAYSYVRAGGFEPAGALGRVVEGTLAFAGEHLAGAAIGTVEGAIESGRRAARALVAAMSRRIEITMSAT